MSWRATAISVQQLDRFSVDLEALAAVLGRELERGPSAQIDPELLDAAEAVRHTLELLLEQRIAFKGEDRRASGPVVFSAAEAVQVSGELAGVRAGLARSGRIEGVARVDDVSGSGSVAGVSLDTIG